MSIKPVLEIIIPYYRGGGLFDEAMQSVLAQSDSNWMLTVLDDASPDDRAARLVQSIDDARVRYIRHAMNQGISNTFAHALHLSRGRWTTIMGQDDHLLPNYVTVVRQLAATHPDVTMIQPGVRVIDAQGRSARTMADTTKALLRPRTPRVLRGQRLATSLLLGNWLYFPAIAWETLRARRFGFDPDMRIAMDLDHELRQVLEGAGLAYDNTQCFEYRRHRSSVSSESAALGARFEEEDALFHAWAKRLRAHGWHQAALAAHWHPTSRAHRLAAIGRRSGSCA